MSSLARWSRDLAQGKWGEGLPTFGHGDHAGLPRPLRRVPAQRRGCANALLNYIGPGETLDFRDSIPHRDPAASPPTSRPRDVLEPTRPGASRAGRGAWRDRRRPGDDRRPGVTQPGQPARRSRWRGLNGNFISQTVPVPPGGRRQPEPSGPPLSRPRPDRRGRASRACPWRTKPVTPQPTHGPAGPGHRAISAGRAGCRLVSEPGKQSLTRPRHTTIDPGLAPARATHGQPASFAPAHGRWRPVRPGRGRGLRFSATTVLALGRRQSPPRLDP